LVSAKNNQLLIDEIETGLHYSVLEQLWALIFKYAQALNVQVFATTHSYDAIKTFTYLTENEGNEDQGAYFRLQTNRKTGLVEAISYDAERLESALETESEIR
jgi:AAA15 family ATPase/GTPase